MPYSALSILKTWGYEEGMEICRISTPTSSAYLGDDEVAEVERDGVNYR